MNWKGLHRHDDISIRAWALKAQAFLEATHSPALHQEPKHFHESPQAPIVYVIYDLGAFSFQGIGP